MSHLRLKTRKRDTNDMRITNEEKQEVVAMYKTGKYYLKEIAEWLGISLSSVIKILKENKNANEKKTNQL